MGRLRNRDGSEGTRYTMREKMFSIGDDFWIETEDGERVFKVNGKALRVRETLAIENTSGEELITIQEKKLSVRDKMEVERDGETVATVKKALVGIRDRYSIEVEGGEDLSAKGNIVDHEYEIERDGDKVAEVSKVVPRAGRVRDRGRPRPGRRADPGRRGLHRPDGPRLKAGPDRDNTAMTTTPPGHGHAPSRALRRERLGRELRRRRGLRSTRSGEVVGDPAQTREPGDEEAGAERLQHEEAERRDRHPGEKLADATASRSRPSDRSSGPSRSEFRRFVKETGYVTVAERPLDPAYYPDADPAIRVPGSLVFRPPPRPC